ncbi:unnamed protein product [Caenorhabditis sp. 36 PRJEB53466]|nr:unnamed protein product [Caenorhabditis sp. 36 PRJEB53466]
MNPQMASTSSSTSSATSSSSTTSRPHIPHHLSTGHTSQHIYACSDENSYYASPIFLTRTIDEPPKKAAPTLSRQSTCRPTSQLYLPSKKRKTRCVCVWLEIV